MDKLSVYTKDKIRKLVKRTTKVSNLIKQGN